MTSQADRRNTISMVVAVARNGIIGRDGRLPWRLRSDLQRFKRLTMGGWLLMGRRTYESLPGPLPGRTLIVLTRDENFQTDNSAVHIAHDIDDAIQLVPADKQLFVIGGGEVYGQCLGRTEDILMTLILADVQGDTKLPPLPLEKFELLIREAIPADQYNEYPSEFQHWRRIPGL